MDFEAAWCPFCSRLIEPKRYTVPIQPLHHPTQAPPPTRPQSSRKYHHIPHPLFISDSVFLLLASKSDHPATKRNIIATRRRGGLVEGTGRMQPNGTIKCADSTTSSNYQQRPRNRSKSLKYRTIIDQGPLPLYCSEECRRLDDKASSGSLGTESSGSSSIPSESSTSTACEQLPTPHVDQDPQYTSPSVAILAKLYDFPPPPPPTPFFYEDAEEYRSPLSDNGLIMNGRYLRELCAEPAKPQTGRYRAAPEPVKIVPGWNDGSNAWRSRLYNLTAPLPSPQIKKKRVVRSQLGDASLPLRNPSGSSLPDNTAMINKFSELLSRRPTRTASPSSGATAPRGERSLLPPGPKGKLLVPVVKPEVRTGSSAFAAASILRSPLSATSDSGDNESSSSKSNSTQSPALSSCCQVPESEQVSFSPSA